MAEEETDKTVDSARDILDREQLVTLVNSLDKQIAVLRTEIRKVQGRLFRLEQEKSEGEARVLESLAKALKRKSGLCEPQSGSPW